MSSHLMLYLSSCGTCAVALAETPRVCHKKYISAEERSEFLTWVKWSRVKHVQRRSGRWVWQRSVRGSALDQQSVQSSQRSKPESSATPVSIDEQWDKTALSATDINNFIVGIAISECLPFDSQTVCTEFEYFFDGLRQTNRLYKLRLI